jgi:hypothetical protein
MMNWKYLPILLATAALAGCSSEPQDGYTPPGPPTQAKVDDSIAKIQNNPNMSQQQKDMAINAIKSSADMQRQMATANSGKKAPPNGK